MELGKLHGGVVGSYGINGLQSLIETLRLQNYGGLVHFKDCLCSIHRLEYADTLADIPNELKIVSAQVTASLISSTHKRIKKLTQGTICSKKDTLRSTSSVRRAKLERLTNAAQSDEWEEAAQITEHKRKRNAERLRRQKTGVVRNDAEEKDEDERDAKLFGKSVRKLEYHAALSVFAKMDVVAKLMEKKRQPVDLLAIRRRGALTTDPRLGSQQVDRSRSLAARRRVQTLESTTTLPLGTAVTMRRLLTQARRRQTGDDEGSETDTGSEVGSVRGEERSGSIHSGRARSQSRTQTGGNKLKIRRTLSSAEKRRTLLLQINTQV